MNMMIRQRPTETPAHSDQAPQFVHLRVHSAYSLLEGALPVARLAKLAVADQAPALALTDRNNLFGALEFSNKLSDAGVQPITGLTLSVDFSDAVADSKYAPASVTARSYSSIALLAMSEVGYANLMKLSSQAFFNPSDAEDAHVRIECLRAHHEDLIVLSGGPEGPVDQMLVDGDRAKAEQRLTALKDVFGQLMNAARAARITED